MQSLESYLLAIIAFLGVAAGPVITYFSLRKKTGSEALLIDTQTVKSWSETRAALEQEIRDLYSRLDEERAKRQEAEIKSEEATSELRRQLALEREERRIAEDSYREAFERMQGEIDALREKLLDC